MPRATPTASSTDAAVILAHVMGIPVEETALTFAPVMLLVIARLRVSRHPLIRKATELFDAELLEVVEATREDEIENEPSHAVDRKAD